MMRAWPKKNWNSDPHSFPFYCPECASEMYNHSALAKWHIAIPKKGAMKEFFLPVSSIPREKGITQKMKVSWVIQNTNIY